MIERLTFGCSPFDSLRFRPRTLVNAKWNAMFETALNEYSPKLQMDCASSRGPSENPRLSEADLCSMALFASRGFLCLHLYRKPPVRSAPAPAELLLV